MTTKRFDALQVLGVLAILVGAGVIVFAGFRFLSPAPTPAPTPVAVTEPVATTTTTTTSTTTTSSTIPSDLDLGLAVVRVPSQVPEELSDRVMTLTPVLDGLRLPTAGIAEPGTERWYLLEKEGWVRLVDGGVLQEHVVLDIEERVGSEGESGERGLVGIALHPGFERNRRVFLSYTDMAGDLVVVEHQVSEDGTTFSEDPVAELLRVGQPGQYHHGGRLVFGPDGYLWIGLGDGGGGGGPDPYGHAQNPGALLGSLLRIDIDAVRGVSGRSVRSYAIPPDNPFVGSEAGAPEVWAYGLRNPWGFDFDDGNLYIADVGDVTFEEINIMPVAESRGVNFGWGVFEGPLCIKPDHCDEIDAVPPILTLSRPGLCAVIGGPVYRGSAMPHLVGHYVYSDYCTGAIVTVKYEDGEVVEHLDWRDHTGSGYNITGLFEDDRGEIHAIDRFGQILRLDPVE